ncbi:hypothetical protein HZS_5523 [Henneguya salminicola]|nr:hypothetical protein HZS_5523 [Henneguya salminicola]
MNMLHQIIGMINIIYYIIISNFDNTGCLFITFCESPRIWHLIDDLILIILINFQSLPMPLEFKKFFRPLIHLINSIENKWLGRPTLYSTY